MRMKDKTNEQLLLEFETACFRLIKYPTNISIVKDFVRLEKEMGRRLGVTLDEYNIVNEY